MTEILAVVALVIVFTLREWVARQEHKELMAERSELLNRIKPETAQLSNYDLPELVEPVRTDQDYWEAHENQLKIDETYPFGGEEEAKGR